MIRIHFMFKQKIVQYMENPNYLQEEVEDQHQQDLVPKRTKLYQKAIEQFRIRVFLLFLERIYLIISMSIILWNLGSNGCGWNGLHYWVLFSDIQAIFSLLLYLQIFYLGNDPNVVDKFAEQYVQIVYVPKEQINNPEDPVAPESFDQTSQYTDQELSKKSDVLSMQIRSEIIKESLLCRLNHYFSTVTNQLVFIWTMYYFIGSSAVHTTQPCDKWPIIQTYVYGVLLFLQYSHYYLLAAILLLFSPVIIIYLIIKCCKNRSLRKRAQMALLELQQTAISYKPNSVQGEQECSICMEPYTYGDSVLTLPCCKLHHFHTICITAWLNVQTTCPNCRTPILAEQQPLLENQLIQ